MSISGRSKYLLSAFASGVFFKKSFFKYSGSLLGSFIGNKRDFFGNRIYTQIPKTVTAGNRKINVLSLPQNAPENFSGAVGIFDIELTSTKTEFISEKY